MMLAYEIAEAEEARITALHCICEPCKAEELEDRVALLREIVEDEPAQVARPASRSLLLVRRYEPAAISWVRRQVRR